MHATQSVNSTYTRRVRQFNRFYTRQAGLLDGTLLDSDFSLTEARIMYELALCDELTASQLGLDLGLDAGYLSRLIRKFEARGLLSRTRSNEDARRSLLSLTPAGRTAYKPLNRSSQQKVAALLQQLPIDRQQALVNAMALIERLLGPEPDHSTGFTFRSLEPGDIGWVTHRQSVLYHQEYDWDETYDALVAEILSAFVTNFNAEKERAWIAECDGQIAGSVFVVQDNETTARLRLLYVEPKVRGLGLGQQLVDQCIHFARDGGYAQLVLWTNDVLTTARRLYEKNEFRLVSSSAHRSFGKDLIGQNWVLEL